MMKWLEKSTKKWQREKQPEVSPGGEKTQQSQTRVASQELDDRRNRRDLGKVQGHQQDLIPEGTRSDSHWHYLTWNCNSLCTQECNTQAHHTLDLGEPSTYKGPSLGYSCPGGHLPNWRDSVLQQGVSKSAEEDATFSVLFQARNPRKITLTSGSFLEENIRELLNLYLNSLRKEPHAL